MPDVVEQVPGPPAQPPAAPDAGAARDPLRRPRLRQALRCRGTRRPTRAPPSAASAGRRSTARSPCSSNAAFSGVRSWAGTGGSMSGPSNGDTTTTSSAPSCGRIVEFFDSELEALQERIALRRGFRINRHVHELFGTCKECRAARPRAIAENGRRRSRTLA